MRGADASFWSWQLIVAMGLSGVVQCMTIGAYASRIAGAISGRVATAISLFNIFSTAGRFASMIYTPILGSLSDHAGLYSAGGLEHAAILLRFEWQLRWIVLAGAVGTACGTMLLPTFLMLYLRAIGAYERLRSVPRAFLRLFVPSTAARVLRSVRIASPAGMKRVSLVNVPRDVLVLNTLVTAVYGVGVLAAAYASVLNPAAARTALLSSGLINGIATVAYNVVVDPTSAYVTDQAVRGERSVNDVKWLIVSLGITGTLGFMLSQLLLVPAALVVEWAARLVTGR